MVERISKEAWEGNPRQEGSKGHPVWEAVRLLIIIPSNARGGAEECALRMALGVSGHWSVHVALPEGISNGSLGQELRSKGIVTHVLKIPGRYFIRAKEEHLWKNASFRGTGMVLKSLHAVERNYRRLIETRDATIQLWWTSVLLLRVRPDVALLNLPWPTFGMGILMACALSRVPTAVLFHSYPFPFSFRPSRVRAYNWARGRDQRWLTVSEHDRNLLSGSLRINPARIARLHTGINQNSIQGITSRARTAAMRREVREELGVPRTARLILSVGRLEAAKGFEELMSTIPHLISEFPDAWFVWLGQPDQPDALRAELEELRITHRILLAGYRRDVPRFMHASDLFVLPSRMEGLPLVLLEAMASGLPVVSTRVGGVPELITHGDNGLLTRIGDSCDLLEALRWALRNPRKMRSMAHRARQRAREFSEERMVAEITEVLRGLRPGGDSRVQR